MELKNRFAVVKLWDTACAEDENIARIVDSSRALNIECVPVDKHYRFLSDKTQVATEDNFDFVLHLHFESLKINNLFSFVTLWNPTQFFHDWGYRQYSDHLITHDDFLTSHSTGAENHLSRLIYKDSFHLPPLFELFPASSEHIHLPERRTDRRLHYCGINWEKVSGKKSRHDDILSLLDKNNLADIYGPEMLGKVKLWTEFGCYRGEIPFDGVSLIDTIRNSGVSLVLSSPAHIESELMSNRLFEALAAGVNIICDENAFAKKYMGDSVLYLDMNASPAQIVKQLEEHLSWLNHHPDEAYAMAVKSQEVFFKTFNLKERIKYIYNNLIERKKQIQSLYSVDCSDKVQVCVICNDVDTDTVKGSIEGNLGSNFYYHVYCLKSLEKNFARSLGKLQNTILKPCLGDFIDRNGDIHYGKLVAQFFTQIADEDKFMVVMAGESLLKNHVSALLKKNNLDQTDVTYSNGIENVAENALCPEYISREVSALHIERMPVSAFLFSKQLYKDTFSFYLPHVNSLILVYFLALAQNMTSTRKFSCVWESKRKPFKARSADFDILEDLKQNANIDVFSEEIDIPIKRGDTFILQNLVATLKPILKKLPGSSYLRSGYRYLKSARQKSVCNVKVKVRIK